MIKQAYKGKPHKYSITTIDSVYLFELRFLQPQVPHQQVQLSPVQDPKGIGA